MTKDKFAEFIICKRKEKGYTQNDLALRLHVTDKAISKWERGINYPDIVTLKNLAKQLGVSVLELLEGENNMEDNKNNSDIDEAVDKTLNFSKELLRNQKRNYLNQFIILIITVTISAVSFQFINQSIGLFGVSIHDVISQLNELGDRVNIIQKKTEEINLYGNGIYYCYAPDNTFESIEFVSADVIRVYKQASPQMLLEEWNSYFQIKKIGARQYTIIADAITEDTLGTFNMESAKLTWNDYSFNFFKVIEVSEDHKTLYYGSDHSFNYCLLNKQP